MTAWYDPWVLVCALTWKDEEKLEYEKDSITVYLIGLRNAYNELHSSIQVIQYQDIYCITCILNCICIAQQYTSDAARRTGVRRLADQALNRNDLKKCILLEDLTAPSQPSTESEPPAGSTGCTLPFLSNRDTRNRLF